MSPVRNMWILAAIDSHHRQSQRRRHPVIVNEKGRKMGKMGTGEDGDGALKYGNIVLNLVQLPYDTSKNYL
jgi:hypothetical protein